MQPNASSRPVICVPNVPSRVGDPTSSIQELQGYALVVVAMLAAAAFSLLVQDTQPRNDQGGLMAH